MFKVLKLILNPLARRSILLPIASSIFKSLVKMLAAIPSLAQMAEFH